MNQLDWLLQEIKTKGTNCPKTVIYCTSTLKASKLHEWMLIALGNSAWVDGDSCHRYFSNRIICQFHRIIDEVLEGAVFDIFPKVDSHLRVLVSTIAFGIGVNIPDIEIVVHWGLSDSICHYWQEVGRCARNVKSGRAVLYPVRLTTDKPFGKMINNHLESPTCVRILILSQFVMTGIDDSLLAVLKERKDCSAKCDVCECVKCACCNYCKISDNYVKSVLGIGTR